MDVEIKNKSTKGLSGRFDLKNFKYGECIKRILGEKKYTGEEAINLLSYDVTIPEIDVIRDIFCDEKFEEFLKKVWKCEENELAKGRKLPNSAIDLNNKMVEIIQYYEAKGFSFGEEIQKTSLARTIMEDLFSSYLTTLQCLLNAKDKTDTMGSVSNLRLNIDDDDELALARRMYLVNMACYQYIAENELWRYDIEKKVVGSILRDLHNNGDKQGIFSRLKSYVDDMRRLRFKSTNRRTFRIC